MKDSESFNLESHDFEDERTDVFINVYDLIPENDYGKQLFYNITFWSY